MYTATPLGAELYYVFWFFFIYCFLGVIVEMVFCYAREGVIESRVGLLYLPLSPIYGFGGVLLTLFLLPYIKEPVLMFFVGILVGTVLEYVASFVMEKLFHTVFWDYSDKPLNLHGRVCLQYSFYWGLLSILLLYVLGDWTKAFVDLFPRSTGVAIVTIMLVLAVLSTVLTLAAFTRLRQRVAALHAASGGTPSAVSASRFWRLVDRLVPDPVLINTFPRMSLVTEYCELAGLQRKWIRIDAHLGRPSALHRRMRARALGETGTNGA